MNIVSKSQIFNLALTTVLAVAFSFFLLGSTPAAAVTNSEPTTEAQCIQDKNATLLGLPKWYKYLEVVPDESGRCSPQVDGINGVLPIGLVVLEGMLRLAGVVAVVMIFWSGFKFLLSQGNPDAVTSARKVATNALIGLVIVIVATGLVSFVGGRLLS